MTLSEVLSQGLGRKTLARRMGLIQLLFVVILAVLIGLLSYALIFVEMHRQYRTMLWDNTVATASMSKNFIDTYSRYLEQLLDERVLDKYTHTLNDPILLQHFERFYRYFEAISYANAEGIEMVKQYRDNRKVELQDISASSLFTRSQAAPNTVVLGESERSAQQYGEPVLQLGIFVISYFGEKLGFISATIPLEALDSIFEELQRRDGVRIVVNDSKGLILYDSLQQWVGQRHEENSLVSASSWQSVGVQIARGSFLNVDDCLISTALVEPYGWEVHNLLTAADFAAPLHRYGLRLFLVVTVVSAVVIALVLLSIHLMMRPIRLLTDAARMVAESGNLNCPVDWKSDDDIGGLAHSFNVMLDHLRSTHSALQDERIRTENIISSMADALFVTDPAHLLVKVNDAFCVLLDLPEKKILGKNILDLFVIEKTPLYKAIVENGFPAGRARSVGSSILDGNGRQLFVSISGALLKDSMGNTVGNVFVAKDITKLRQVNVRLNHLANHDSLTGLPNRMLLGELLRQIVSRIPRHDRLVAVMLVDLDRFKFVNDALGHSAGDQLIKVMGERLVQSIRSDDVVARFGGDEFVVVLNDVATLDDIKKIAEKILSAFSEKIDLEGHPYTATASIGISTAPDQANSPEMLMKNADMAMYQAKWQGRNTYCIYSPDMHFDTRSIFTMEVAIRHALEDEAFTVHFQPVIGVLSQRVVGVEALVRWERNDGSFCPPAEFLPIAEETGLIVPLGRWVLEYALAQIKICHDLGFTDLALAVNLSDRQFRDAELIMTLSKLLSRTKFPVERLDVELTETILMQDVGQACFTVSALKELGTRISVDDFGTGYSSLAHLKRFSLDILKIDRSFVSGLPESRSDSALITAIVGIARALDIDLIAEGIETEAQAVFLRNAGVDMLQGYLFSRPIPAQELQTFLVQKSGSLLRG